MTIHNSTAELIGNTPLIRLNHVTEGIKATIAAKVEYFNPGGSSKDRIAERIIDAAEQSGELKPGGVIVEPTSGNTGVGLAMAAQQRGYRAIFTLPDKVSEAKRAVLRAYGAEVVVTPHRRRSGRSALLLPGGGPSRQSDSRRLPPQPVRQSERSRKPLSHHWSGNLGGHRPQGHAFRGGHRHRRHHLRHRPLSEGRVQRRGAGHRRRSGRLHLLNPDDVHQYQIEGVGEDFYPKAFDRSLPDEIVQVTDAEAFEMTRRLANEEGLLVGGSSGMAVFSALKYAREHDLDENQLVVVLMPDSGRSYMEKIFNDDWMRANGFADVVERTTKPSLAEQYL